MKTSEWSPSGLDDHLSELADQMTLGMIMTPVDSLISVSYNATVATVIDLMGTHFDQLPVLTNGNFSGMIFRHDIPENTHGDSSLSQFCNSLTELASVHANQTMQDAIICLCHHKCCMVFDTSTGEFCGLLHFSDLNKQVVRIYCYLWTSALELSLARLLSKHIPNYTDWIDSLSEQRQIQVLGRFEIGKRQNLVLSPIEGLELSDLVNIYAKQSELLKVIGLSKSQFQKRANHLIDLRHRSMHPVRSLIKNHSDVNSLAGQIEDLRYMVSMVTNPKGS